MRPRLVGNSHIRMLGVRLCHHLYVITLIHRGYTLMSLISPKIRYIVQHDSEDDIILATFIYFDTIPVCDRRTGRNSVDYTARSNAARNKKLLNL